MTCADWAQLGGVLALAAVALVVAVFGSYLADLGRRICLAPKLKVEFGRQHGFCHGTYAKYTVADHSEFLPVYYFRFSIENGGKSLARSCEVILEEICSSDDKGQYHLVREFWPTSLKWEGGAKQIDINPKRPPLYVNIGFISHPEAQLKYEHSTSTKVDPTDTRLRFILDLPYPRPFAKIDCLFPGRHLLKFTIVGENFQPLRRQFELSWSGNWTDDEGQMLSKEAVITVSDLL